MSSENDAYKNALQRGLKGKSDAQALLDVERLLDTDKDRAARQRGFEAGAAVRAASERLSQTERSESRSRSTSSSSDEIGLQLLFVVYPLVSLVSAAFSYLIGVLVVHLAKTPIAAGARALGSTPDSIEAIYATNSWIVATPVAVVVFAWLLLRWTIRWFSFGRNREELKDATYFVLSLIAFGFFVYALYRVWGWLSQYAGGA